MPSRLKIYTKTGDTGETSLYGGKRVGKDDQRVVAYGTVDELNSALGVLISQLVQKRHAELVSPSAPASQKVLNPKHGDDIQVLRDFFLTIQSDLFVMGAALAGNEKQPLETLEQRITDMERLIDAMDGQLPQLKHFVLPGGHPATAFSHLVRAICRRSEREVIALLHTGEAIPTAIIQYLNRLSDLLFITARYLHHLDGQEDILWKQT